MSYTMKPSIGMLPIDELIEIISEKINNSNIELTAANARAYIGEPMSYALEADVEGIKDNMSEIWINGSDEIQLLRDEIYQLKAELIKNKIIEDTLVADGFIEGFNLEKIKYDNRNVTITESSKEGLSQKTRLFEKDDYLIAKKDISKPESYAIAKVEYEDGNFLEFDINTIDFAERISVLSKSLGQYINNTFSFSSMINDVEAAYPIGLYTTRSPIYISDCVKASRARLTLEISKEGLYKTNIRKTNDSYNVIRVDNIRNMFMPGDDIIIGTILAKVVATPDKTKLIINKNICVEDGTPIYKCAYEAILKTYIKDYDQETGLEYIRNNTKQCHKFKLISVIPTRDLNSPISDRLIFECSSINSDFNTAGLQIKWDSTYSGPLENEFIGRIHGLSLAFDKLV